MVFLSAIRFITKATGRDKSIGRAKIFRLSGKFHGRERNCYRLAIRAVHKAFLRTTQFRQIEHMENSILRATRLDAACAEHDTTRHELEYNLFQANVHLHHVLVDLAIWEPKTFKCLTEIARAKRKNEASEDVARHIIVPDSVINRKSL